MTVWIKREDVLALLDLIAGGEEYIDNRERLIAALPTIDPATIDAETQAMGDAMLYGVGIMQGGKHINLQYFFAQPDPAAIREAALREAYIVVHKWWMGDWNASPQERILALIGEKK